MTRLAAVERSLDDMTGASSDAERESHAWLPRERKDISRPRCPGSERAGRIRRAEPRPQIAPACRRPGRPAICRKPGWHQHGRRACRRSPDCRRRRRHFDAPRRAATSARRARSRTQSAAYGVDLGSAVSIQTAEGALDRHPLGSSELFEGLRRSPRSRKSPRSKRIELRLVVGPLPTPERRPSFAPRWRPFARSCQPTTFDGQHLADQ